LLRCCCRSSPALRFGWLFLLAFASPVGCLLRLVRLPLLVWCFARLLVLCCASLAPCDRRLTLRTFADLLTAATSLRPPHTTPPPLAACSADWRLVLWLLCLFVWLLFGFVGCGCLGCFVGCGGLCCCPFVLVFGCLCWLGPFWLDLGLCSLRRWIAPPALLDSLGGWLALSAGWFEVGLVGRLAWRVVGRRVVCWLLCRLSAAGCRLVCWLAAWVGRSAADLCSLQY